jgi:dipeptidyl aminopeptidase/acylaminoacyl peptidase
MQRTRWRVLLLALALFIVVQPRVRAAEPRLDDPGTYLVEVASGRSVKVGRNAMVAWSPDSTMVALTEPAAGPPQPRLRFVQAEDGAVSDVKVPDQGEINHLRWAPDGSALAFTLTRMGRDPGPALLVADPATGAVRQVVRGNIGDLAWTPDSSGITAITLEEGGGSIVTFDAKSGEIRESVPDAKDASCKRGLTWSPDGALLAWGGPGLHEGCGDAGNWGVWVWQPARKTTRQVFQGAADVPHWLATGELVAMVSAPETDSDQIPLLSVVRLSPDGGDPQPIAKDVPRMFPEPPQLVQASGSVVLYPVSTCDRGEAYVWKAGQPEAARATPEIVYAYRPWLAPDGGSLAYVQIGEPNQLLVAPVDQGQPQVVLSSGAGLQVGTAGPWDPGGDWSPDGRWLAVEVTTEQFKDCPE